LIKYDKYNDYELLYLLSWHSEEALKILLNKYDILILKKLEKFNVLKYHYADYIQELRFSVYKAINRYSECYGKTLCRFLELVIDRKIMRLLSDDTQCVKTVNLMDSNIPEYDIGIEKKMIYEQRIYQIKQIQLDDFKRDLFEKIILEGESVKEYAERNGVSTKEIYNHVYLLRLKIKEKINL
jgi:DNA-directed RNA polymerase specialized sigma24 family protein